MGQAPDGFLNWNLRDGDCKGDKAKQFKANLHVCEDGRPPHARFQKPSSKKKL